MSAPPPRTARALPWVLIGLSLLVLAVVELTRPLADPVAPVAAGTFLSDDAVARATAYREPLRWAALLSLALRIGAAALAAWWLVHRPDRGVPGSRWRRCRGRGWLPARRGCRSR